MTARRTTGPETSSRTELVTTGPAEALAGVLDIAGPAAGADLPELWHWVYLLDRRPQRDLGPDGHPTSGIPAPPEPGRSRMFGGGRVSTYAPLRFGRPASRTTRLVREVEKAGASGPMTLVTVRTDIEQDGRVAIVDEQDIVYRGAGPTLTSRAAAAAQDEEPAPEGRLDMRVDPVVLFRFSALTYNAHRIHYDAPYAAGEGYPDLVVHGPLQALLMGECFRRSGISLVGTTFAYRLVAPTFGAQLLTVTSRVADGERSARVQDGRGRTTATATVQRLDVAGPMPAPDGPLPSAADT
ncbi:MAG: 3-methylfumaryl-CoA hydratase [Modestobacter sp.]|jgi:3-methylfumaryl-CoA hydratase|nr:3-methylfumaryl-CoA hydratase [Modestobacter sp.]